MVCNICSLPSPSGCDVGWLVFGQFSHFSFPLHFFYPPRLSPFSYLFMVLATPSISSNNRVTLWLLCSNTPESGDTCQNTAIDFSPHNTHFPALSAHTHTHTPTPNNIFQEPSLAQRGLQLHKYELVPSANVSLRFKSSPSGKWLSCSHSQLSKCTLLHNFTKSH